MKRFLLTALFLMFAPGLRAGDNSLCRVYQPLNPMVDRSVEVYEVPFVSGRYFPESLYEAITLPHIPQQRTQHEEGDINMASLAGISLHCEASMKPNGGGTEKIVLTFDFTQAKPERVDNDLIDALLECIAKTSGKTRVTSKMKGAEKFPKFVKRIQAKLPPEPVAKK